ncbi:MAG TPA: 4'-phosphopantetheinyl transferase superfamily protein, partial [Solirubrobacterales bacterium]|nr:4'-phosphopantetheinyl transferase superfamily protein [Solirubrobacterales bacterium]
KRRADWRLGRWAAKAAVAAWREVAPESVVITAADDGAPEPLIDGERVDVALSLSHRARRALATVTDGSTALGCDLEALEPRSPAFLREWLRPTERDLVGAQAPERRELAANLVWTAKEAASKARREGLRLNVRQATVEVEGLDRPPDTWAPLRITWMEGPVESGWWRGGSGWVMTVVSDPHSDAPPSELT